VQADRGIVNGWLWCEDEKKNTESGGGSAWKWYINEDAQEIESFFDGFLYLCCFLHS